MKLTTSGLGCTFYRSWWFWRHVMKDFRASKAVDILQDLVAFKTVSRKPNISCIDYLDDYFGRLGFLNKRIYHPKDEGRANLLCHIGPDVPGGLMLSGHTDVVPVAGQ